MFWKQFFTPDLTRTTDIVGLAISIEAQALDLYFRAADKATETGVRTFLQDMAEEEKRHIDRLGDLLENLTGREDAS